MELTVGELVNQHISDSAAFGLPLLYHSSSPAMARDDNGALAPKTPDYGAFAPNMLGLPQPRTQFPLHSLLSLSQMF